MDLQQNKATAYASQENREAAKTGRPSTTIRRGELHPKLGARLSVQAQDCGAWLNEPQVYIEPVALENDSIAPLGWLEWRYPHLQVKCPHRTRTLVEKASDALKWQESACHE